MMTYRLQELVKVRQVREERAGEQVVRAANVLKQAQVALTRVQIELAEYASWRVQEEQRRLDALMRRVLKLGELADARTEISLLREREFEYLDRVKQAEAEVHAAEQRLDEARQAHLLRVRELEKLLEHRAIWQQEQARELERTENLELEEFTSAPRLSALLG